MRSPLLTFFSLFFLAAACSPEDSSPGGEAGTGAASGAGGAQGGAGGSAGTAGTTAGTQGGSAGSSGAGAGGAGNGGSAGSSGGAGNGGAGSGGGGNGGSAGTSGGNGGSAGSGECTPSSGTEDVGSSSVRDKATCLVWQKTASAKNTNKQALKYCDELSQDGFDDWRVPTTSELVSWPLLVESGDAYITAPTYIPTASTSDEEGCIGNCHSCNITKYSAGGMAGCAWQGVDFKGPTVCVRGLAAAGTLPAGFEPNSCGPCAGKTDSEFKQVDCLPYATP